MRGINKMAVQQSLSTNNFWGLVEQKGPWQSTRNDNRRSRNGGIRHPGHGDWKVLVNPYQQDGSKPPPEISKILQRTVVTTPLKFSVGPSQVSMGVGPIGVGSREMGQPKAGHPGYGRRPQDENPDEFPTGPGLADNNQAEYQTIAQRTYANMTKGVNQPGGSFGFAGPTVVNFQIGEKHEQSEASLGKTETFDVENQTEAAIGVSKASQTAGRLASDVRTVVGPRGNKGLNKYSQTLPTVPAAPQRPIVDPALLQELGLHLESILNTHREITREEHSALMNTLQGIDTTTADTLRGLQGTRFLQQVVNLTQVTQQQAQVNLAQVNVNNQTQVNEYLFTHQQGPPPSTSASSQMVVYPRVEHGAMYTEPSEEGLEVSYPNTGTMLQSTSDFVSLNASSGQAGDGTLQITGGSRLAIDNGYNTYGTLAIEAAPLGRGERIKKKTKKVNVHSFKGNAQKYLEKETNIPANEQSSSGSEGKGGKSYKQKGKR